MRYAGEFHSSAKAKAMPAQIAAPTQTLSLKAQKQAFGSRLRTRQI